MKNFTIGKKRSFSKAFDRRKILFVARDINSITCLIYDDDVIIGTVLWDLICENTTTIF